MKKNKINYIKIIKYGNFPYGGASANYLRYFALGLADQGNEVEVILPTGSYYGNKVETNNQKKGNVKNVTYQHLCYKQHPKNYFGKIADILGGSFIAILYIIRSKAQRKINVIIKYNTSLSINIVYFLIAKFLRIKILFLIPEFYDKPKSPFCSFGKLKWYNFYLGLRYFTKFADGLIVFSTFLEEFFIKRVGYTKPILVQPNLVDPGVFKMKFSNSHRESKITIGYAGTPTRKDGIVDLLESFSIVNKKHPETHLMVIGDITNGQSIIPKLKEIATKKNIVDQITFTGLVPYSKIPELLNACDILALIRPKGVFAEAGFPIKLGEYFSCKKPVIITKVGDIQKYFTDKEQVILVKPEDIDDIVKGFELLIKDKTLSKTIGVKGYQWMKKNLDYKVASVKINFFIEKILLNK